MKVYLDGAKPLIKEEGDRLSVLSFDMEREGTQAKFLGMVHHAEPSFYDERNRELEEDPSRVVLLEGVGNKDPEHPSFEIQALARFFNWEAMCLGPSMVRQVDVFPENMQNVFHADLTMEEVGQGNTGRVIEWVKQSVLKNELEVPELELPEEVTRYLQMAFKARLAHALVGACSVPEVLVRPSPIYRGLVVKRNAYLAALLNQFPGNIASPIFVPWGVAHFPDLVRHFYPSGWKYVPDSARYTPFMTVPSNWDVLKGAFPAVRALTPWLKTKGPELLKAEFFF